MRINLAGNKPVLTESEQKTAQNTALATPEAEAASSQGSLQEVMQSMQNDGTINDVIKKIMTLSAQEFIKETKQMLLDISQQATLEMVNAIYQAIDSLKKAEGHAADEDKEAMQTRGIALEKLVIGLYGDFTQYKQEIEQFAALPYMSDALAFFRFVLLPPEERQQEINGMTDWNILEKAMPYYYYIMKNNLALPQRATQLPAWYIQQMVSDMVQCFDKDTIQIMQKYAAQQQKNSNPYFVSVLLLSCLEQCEQTDMQQTAEAFLENIKKILPQVYLPEVLTEENSIYMQPIHAFGYYLLKAREQENIQAANEYLRKALAIMPKQKAVIAFLQKEDPQVSLLQSIKQAAQALGQDLKFLQPVFMQLQTMYPEDEEIQKLLQQAEQIADTQKISGENEA